MAEQPYATPTPTGRVINPYGGPQDRAPGMTGSLPSRNVGVDWAAPLGDPVTAPVSGTVRQVYATRYDDTKGQRDVNENHGYGGQLVLVGDDGSIHKLSHLMYGSLRIKPGERVEKGQQVAQVGQSGNTSDGKGGPFPHTDQEYYDPQGRPADPVPLSRSMPTVRMPRTGDGAMSDQPTAPANPTKQALQDLYNRRRSGEASLVAAYQRALTDRLALDSTASDPQQKAADQKVEDAKAALEAHQKAQRSLEEKIATTSETPKADSAASVTVATNTTEPYIVQRRPDGSLEALPNPNYREKAPPSKRTQVVAGNLIDLDTGDVLAKVPKDARTQVVGNNLVDLDTGRVLASLPEAPGAAEAREVSLETARFNLQEAQRKAAEAQALSPIAGQQAELALQQAQFTFDQAQRKAAQPIDVNAPATQRTLVRRDPTTGALVTEENPAYTPTFGSYGDPVSTYNAAVAQALPIGQAKIAEYQRRADAEPEKAGQFKAELTRWWQQNMAAPLAGLRSAAEQTMEEQRYTRGRQSALDQAALRTEAEKAGQNAVDDETQLLKYRVGPNFAQEKGVAEAAYAQGKEYAFSPSAFVSPMPNLRSIRSSAAAARLAHISPAAAAELGAPMPQFPALPDIEQFIPPYGAGAKEPVA